MPQFQQQKKDQARIRILSADATRAYLFLMRKTGGRLQVLPQDTYVIDENLLPDLSAEGIRFDRLDTK